MVERERRLHVTHYLDFHSRTTSHIAIKYRTNHAEINHINRDPAPRTGPSAPRLGAVCGAQGFKPSRHLSDVARFSSRRVAFRAFPAHPTTNPYP